LQDRPSETWGEVRRLHAEGIIPQQRVSQIARRIGPALRGGEVVSFGFSGTGRRGLGDASTLVQDDALGVFLASED